jgi:hypothetical protein
MATNNYTAEDLLERGNTISFPDSVISFFKGDLGQPHGGFPAKLQKIVLKDEVAYTERPNEHLEPIDFDKEFETFTNDNPLVIGNFKFYTIDVDNKPISIPTSKKQILIILNTSINQSIPIFESNQTYFFGPDSGYYYNASSSEDRTIFLKTYTNIDKNICSGICDITDDCFAYNYYDSSKTCKLIKKFTTFIKFMREILEYTS